MPHAEERKHAADDFHIAFVVIPATKSSTVFSVAPVLVKPVKTFKRIRIS